MKTKDKNSGLLEKLDKGLKLTKKRLVASKKANGHLFTFQEGEKVVRVKAEDV